VSKDTLMIVGYITLGILLVGTYLTYKLARKIIRLMLDGKFFHKGIDINDDKE